MRVLYKETPEAFVVEEIDAYPPSGHGEFAFVRIKKRGLTTQQALERLSGQLSISLRDCSAAGMKDRQAVTTQRLCLPIKDPTQVETLIGRIGRTDDDLEILEVARHHQKLKPGHLHGNRFQLRLRPLEATPEDLMQTLGRLGREGFPNAFGPQRFGRDGNNADFALAFVRGQTRPPKSPHLRRLLFSALQARWFNLLLQKRVENGTWNVPILGDLLKKHETGGLFVCEDVTVDTARAQQLELSPTGPIFGSKMRDPGEPARTLERSILQADEITDEHLLAQRSLGEGTRRILRVCATDFGLAHDGEHVVLTMTLPKGAYATTALSSVVDLVEAGRDERLAQQRSDGAVDVDESPEESREMDSSDR